MTVECKILLYLFFTCIGSGAGIMRGPTHGCQNYNHRIVWVRKDPKDPLAPTPLQWAGTPSTSPGCWKPCPACTWTFPGMGYPTVSLDNLSRCLSSSCASTWDRCWCVGRGMPWCSHPAQQFEVLFHSWPAGVRQGGSEVCWAERAHWQLPKLLSQPY